MNTSQSKTASTTIESLMEVETACALLLYANLSMSNTHRQQDQNNFQHIPLDSILRLHSYRYLDCSEKTTEEKVAHTPVCSQRKKQ